MKLLFIHSELVFAWLHKHWFVRTSSFPFPDKKKKGVVFDAWMWFVQVTRQEFTAVLALKSSAIVYDAQFKIIRLQPVIICA